MGNLLVEDREIVLPGKELAEGMDFLASGPDVIREGEELIALKVGLVSINNRFVKIIPLSGSYVPKVNDVIIGRITSTSFNGWRVDIGGPFEAMIPLREGTSDFIQRNGNLARYYQYDDYVVAQIMSTHEGRMIDLTMKGPGLRKLGPGRIFRVQSCKVPRIIGKQGSMISMIKDHTGCKISVGQNGYVWLSGESVSNELKAIDAINLIVRESHISGLTDRVKELLERQDGNKL